MKKFTPWPYQRDIIAHILEHPRCAIWAGMGMGKTSSTLSAIDLMLISGDVKPPILVIAPLRVATTTWPDEVAKWAHLKGMRVQTITGNPKQREAALCSGAEVFTVNYENIPWLVKHFGARWPFRMVVSDESTRLKGFRKRQGTQRARALAMVAHTKVERFVELTGTPSPNGLQDLWGQAWFLDAGRRLGANFTAFTQRWFQRSFDGYSIDPLPHAQAQIQAQLKDLCLTVDPKDYFDIDEPIIRPVFIDLPKKARETYREMESEMFMELFHDGQEHEVEAFNAAAKTQKCLQLASGAAYLNGSNKEWAIVHDEKIKALESIIEEAAGAPVLVAYHFKSDLARLLEAFPKGRELDKNPDTIRQWNAGKIPVLFAHPASAGHGLNLQDGGNILVFFSHNWNLEEYQQILERIGPMRQKQAGHERPVFVYNIVARRTMDEVVIKRRESKREVQDLLLEAMKKRKEN